MRNTQAIVTLALGDSYLRQWKRVCEPNWRRYGEKHGYDVVCLEQPLDTSERAQLRSPSWQKCLVLSHDALRDYERVVWVDSDILINHQMAPDIAEGVPIDKVGAAEHLPLSHTQPEVGREVLRRASDHWHDVGIVNDTAEEYYTRYGLPPGCNQVFNAGVMVLSPVHHRDLLEYVYDRYEEKGGREWHMEMRPLSYEVVRAGLVHWIDPRYNVLWPDMVFLHYPFLLPSQDHNGHNALTDRVKRKLARSLLNVDAARGIRAACANAGFHNSYFLHFGGSSICDMELIDQQSSSWMDVRL